MKQVQWSTYEINGDYCVMSHQKDLKNFINQVIIL